MYNDRLPPRVLLAVDRFDTLAISGSCLNLDVDFLAENRIQANRGPVLFQGIHATTPLNCILVQM
jgi:hypothetical protein